MTYEKLDIEALLQGTEYELQARRIAHIIKERGYDDTYTIHNLPQIGASFEVNVNLLLATILEQAAKQEEVQAPPETAQVSSEMTQEDEKEVEAEAEAIEATEAARELAEEKGVDLSTVEGTGRRGRIIKADVE